MPNSNLSIRKGPTASGHFVDSDANLHIRVYHPKHGLLHQPLLLAEKMGYKGKGAGMKLALEAVSLAYANEVTKSLQTYVNQPYCKAGSFKLIGVVGTFNSGEDYFSNIMRVKVSRPGSFNLGNFRFHLGVDLAQINDIGLIPRPLLLHVATFNCDTPTCDVDRYHVMDGITPSLWFDTEYCINNLECLRDLRSVSAAEDLAVSNNVVMPRPASRYGNQALPSSAPEGEVQEGGDAA